MPTNLSAVAYDRLCDLLRDAEWQKGGRLPPEAKLADQIGVSRPVLRQALAQMREEGLIQSRQGSGNYVVARNLPADPEPREPELRNVVDLEKCLRFRLALETGAAAEAAQNADDRAIARLQEAVQALEAGSRGESLFEADFAFHLRLAEATDNPFFVRAILRIKPQLRTVYEVGRKLRAIPLDETSRRVSGEHRRVLEAVRAKNPAAARQAMEDHVGAGIKRFFGEEG